MGTLQDLFNSKFTYHDGFIISKRTGKITGVVKEGASLSVELGTKPNKKRYKTHRVIWMMHHGDLEADQFIDHIDGNPLNNRLENLRIADRIQNRANSIGFNKLGLPKGVSKHWNKYVAKIGHDGIREHIGVYNTIEEAEEAYNKRAKELYGEYANTNRNAK